MYPDCLVGTYGEKEAHLFDMVVSETEASGDIFDREGNYSTLFKKTCLIMHMITISHYRY